MDATRFSDINAVQMPYSLDAEQAVLGCVLVDPACMTQVQIYLRPEHFYMPQHEAIFAEMVSIEAVGGKIDPLIVLEGLKKSNVYDEEGGRTYLLQLAQKIPSTANVESYARIVREKYYMRVLVQVSRDTIESVDTQDKTADELLNDAEQRIYDIRQGKMTSGPAKVSDVIINEVYDRLQKLSGEDADEFKGIPTGYSDLDRYISGFHAADLIILGARPATGKTSLALNIARNMSVLSKKKVVFFSLEMTKEQLAQRLLSSEALVTSTAMRDGKLTPKDWEALGTATNMLRDCELYFDDSTNLTVTEIKARVRRLRDVDCVFVDYLGLLSSDTRAENRVQEVSKMTRSLKLMAKDLMIPVFVCAQLSRGSESGSKPRRPGLADLRESGSIEQDADIVLMLYKESTGSEDDDEGMGDQEYSRRMKEIEVIIAKNRHGPTDTVKFDYDGEHTRFIQQERDWL